MLVGMKKELVCERCLNCINDCKETFNVGNCENYKKGFTRWEYQEMIQSQNVNLRKLCKDKKLKLYCLLDMLRGRQHFTYKYRTILDERLLEKPELIPYVKEWEGKNE